MARDWHVFNYDRYVGQYSSYQKAVFAAQCEIGTKRRPERLHAGFYILRGERTFYDIATSAMAKVQGIYLHELRATAGERDARGV